MDEVHNNDLINNTYESNGDYIYQWIGNYINDQLNHNNGRANTCDSKQQSAASSTASAVGTSPCYEYLYQGFGNPVYQVSTLDTGIFVQDNWNFLAPDSGAGTALGL